MTAFGMNRMVRSACQNGVCRANTKIAVRGQGETAAPTAYILVARRESSR